VYGRNQTGFTLIKEWGKKSKSRCRRRGRGKGNEKDEMQKRCSNLKKKGEFEERGKQHRRMSK